LQQPLRRMLQGSWLTACSLFSLAELCSVVIHINLYQRLGENWAKLAKRLGWRHLFTIPLHTRVKHSAKHLMMRSDDAQISP
jgi:hypothetical protein